MRAIGSRVDESQVTQAVRRAADRSNVRVTLLGVSRGTQGTQTYAISDSTNEANVDRFAFQVAEDAARSGRTTTGSEATGSGRLGEAARPLFYNGRVARVVVFSTPLNDVETQRRADPAPDCARRRDRAGCSRSWPASSWRARCRAGSSASSRRPRRWRPATSRSRSRRTPTTSSASSPRPSTTCSASSRSSTRRASASSRRRPTSCARRSSRWAASSSCSRTRSSTRRRASSSWTRSASRSSACRSSPSELLDLSKLEAGSLELRPEPTDVGELARTVATEFTPALAQHDSHLELRLPRSPIEAELRSGARGPDRANPDRQRADPYAARHRRVRQRHAGQRTPAPRGARPRAGHPARHAASHLRAVRTPPTTRRAPASGSRSRASWPSAWTGGSPSTPCRGARVHASSSRRDTDSRHPGGRAAAAGPGRMRRLERQGRLVDGGEARAGRRPRRASRCSRRSPGAASTRRRSTDATRPASSP